MRASLTLGLIVCALIAATWVAAEPLSVTKKPEPKEPESPPSGPAKKAIAKKTTTPLSSREVLARLQLEIDAVNFQDRVRFKEVLQNLSDILRGHDREVPVEINTEAFMEAFGAEAPDPLETDVTFRSNRKRVTVMEVLNQTVRQLGRPGLPTTFVVRSGRVEVVPARFAAKEYLLNQTFRADFKDKRLDAVLEELSDLTGVSIVLDGRAKQKVQTTLTARFNDDVAMQDAVRMLTEMAELKIVYLVTGIFITTPEHATVMQKDLRKAYGIPEPIAPGTAPEPMLGVAQGWQEPTPLTPPLPPNRNRDGP